MDPIKSNSFEQSFSGDIEQVTASVAVDLNNVCERATSSVQTIQLSADSPEPGTCIQEGVSFIETEAKRYSAFLGSAEFEKIDDWGKDIITSAVENLSNFAKDAQGFVEGKRNEELPELFTDQINNLVMYMIEMNPGNGAGMPPAKALYRLYIQLFYTIIKCQPEENFDIYRDQFVQVLQLITEGMKQLMEFKVIWDPEKTMGSYFEALIKAFAKAPYVQEAIKQQMELLN